MPKDTKISCLIFLVTLAISLFSIINIYKLEYPSTYLIHSLNKGSNEYLASDQLNTFKLKYSLEDNFNKTLILDGASSFLQHLISIHANLSFNPIGQLFNATLALDIDNISALNCSLAGTKPIIITCTKEAMSLPISTSIPGPITITKKPSQQYLISGLTFTESIILQNLSLFLENTHTEVRNSTDDPLLNLTLSNYPILQTELNNLLNDISPKNK